MHWWFSHRHLFLASGKVLNNSVCILGLASIICKQAINAMCDLGSTINPFGISYSGCQFPDRPYAEKVCESMVSTGLVIFPGNQWPGDSGSGPQRPWQDDCGPTDLPICQGQPEMHEEQPPHLLPALRPPGGLPPDATGQCSPPKLPPGRSHTHALGVPTSYSVTRTLLFDDLATSPQGSASEQH